jgi:hypothetical protein
MSWALLYPQCKPRVASFVMQRQVPPLVPPTGYDIRRPNFTDSAASIR